MHWAVFPQEAWREHLEDVAMALSLADILVHGLCKAMLLPRDSLGFITLICAKSVIFAVKVDVRRFSRIPCGLFAADSSDFTVIQKLRQIL